LIGDFFASSAGGLREQYGWIAQSVEQRTENPCVAGSIPAPATTLKNASKINGLSMLFELGVNCRWAFVK
jgi:hypothetical protein